MSQRALVPREHGAYAEIFVPLLTALLVRPPTIGAIAWAVAALFAFFAHEPLLVSLGHRGARFREARGRAAKILLVVLGAIASISAVIALISSPNVARVSALVPVVLAGVTAWLVARREEKSALGEVLVGAALSSSALPVALASGAPLATAIFTWLVFAAGFGASTLAVRAVIQTAKAKSPKTSGLARASGAASVLLAAIVLRVVGGVPAFVPFAAAPLVLFSVAIDVAPPSPRRLRTLGWMLVVAAVTTGLIVRGLA